MIFLNLGMSTNLADFQNLKSSQRFTPPAGKTSQQTENIQTDGSKPEHVLPDGVRPNLVSPNFWPWFRAFEYEEEGAEESNRRRLGAGQPEEDKASRGLRVGDDICSTDEVGSFLGSHQFPSPPGSSGGEVGSRV